MTSSTQALALSLVLLCAACGERERPMTLSRAVQTLSQAALVEDSDIEMRVATELAQNASVPTKEIAGAFLSQGTNENAVPALGLCLDKRGFDFRTVKWTAVLPRLSPRRIADRARVQRFVECDETYVLSVLLDYLKCSSDEWSKAFVARLAMGHHKDLASRLASAGQGEFVKRIPSILVPAGGSTRGRTSR